MIRRLALPACLVLIAALGITYTAVANAAPPQQQEYARYHNDRWHFTIPVPADMTYTEYDGPAGTSQTIQFSDGFCSLPLGA